MVTNQVNQPVPPDALFIGTGLVSKDLPAHETAASSGMHSSLHNGMSRHAFILKFVYIIIKQRSAVKGRRVGSKPLLYRKKRWQSIGSDSPQYGLGSRVLPHEKNITGFHGTVEVSNRSHGI